MLSLQSKLDEKCLRRDDWEQFKSDTEGKMLFNQAETKNQLVGSPE